MNVISLIMPDLRKSRAKKNHIYCLNGHNDQLKEGTDNVMKIIPNFYSNLYRKEVECEVTQDEFLDNIQVRLSEDERNDIDRDIEVDKLRKSLSDLQKRKSPGCEGLTREFYDFFLA